MSLATDIGKVALPSHRAAARSPVHHVKVDALLPYLVPVGLILAWQAASTRVRVER